MNFHEAIFNYVELENPDFLTIAIFYIILAIPTLIILRALIFFILPKSWLKKIFKI